MEQYDRRDRRGFEDKAEVICQKNSRLLERSAVFGQPTLLFDVVNGAKCTLLDTNRHKNNMI